MPPPNQPRRHSQGAWEVIIEGGALGPGGDESSSCSQLRRWSRQPCGTERVCYLAPQHSGGQRKRPPVSEGGAAKSPQTTTVPDGASLGGKALHRGGSLLPGEDVNDLHGQKLTSVWGATTRQSSYPELGGLNRAATRLSLIHI